MGHASSSSYVTQSKLIIDILCPISSLNQQLNNLEQTHIQCSLHCDGWTVKGKDFASALHSFKEITYLTDEWTKRLLRLKSWVICGNPEPRREFRRLWWTVIVFKCSHLFHLFDFYCLLVQQKLFFRKFTFFWSRWWLWVRSKTSSITSM